MNNVLEILLSYPFTKEGSYSYLLEGRLGEILGSKKTKVYL